VNYPPPTEELPASGEGAVNRGAVASPLLLEINDASKMQVRDEILRSENLTL